MTSTFTFGGREVMMNKIFVFGSNLAGRHGAGSAKEAVKNWGAKYGVGYGHVGNSFAIPTKNEKLYTLPLVYIAKFVEQFIEYAYLHPELEFHVVKIGCGLAGYKEEQIAPMFVGAPDNVILPDGWRQSDTNN